jgi:hypothetical protein
VHIKETAFLFLFSLVLAQPLEMVSLLLLYQVISSEVMFSGKVFRVNPVYPVSRNLIYDSCVSSVLSASGGIKVQNPHMSTGNILCSI